jgi:hypothetical protein
MVQERTDRDAGSHADLVLRGWASLGVGELHNDAVDALARILAASRIHFRRCHRHSSGREQRQQEQPKIEHN